MRISFGSLLRKAFNILHFTHGFLAKRLSPYIVLPPFRVTLFITDRCNLSCSFCYNKGNFNSIKQSVLSVDEWKRIIDSIPLTTAITITGGEPFLAPNFIEILEYACKTKKLVSVITNGSLLNDDMVKKIIDVKPTYFMFSLDGIGTYHNEIRGKNIFDDVAQNLVRMVELRNEHGNTFPKIGIKSVISNDNYGEIKKLIQFAESSGVDDIQFKFLYNNPLQQGLVFTESLNGELWDVGNSFRYSSSEASSIKLGVKDILSTSKSSKTSVGISIDTADIESVTSYIDNPKAFGVKACSKPWNEFTIYPDGEVTPCITYKVCNVRDIGYHVGHVLKHKKYLNFLSAMNRRFPYPAVCEGCNLTSMKKIK